MLRFFNGLVVIIVVFSVFELCKSTLAQPATPAATTTWQVTFNSENVTIQMNTEAIVQLKISNVDITEVNTVFQIQSSKPELANIEKDNFINVQDFDRVTRSWNGNVTISGVFLGVATIYVERIDTVTNIKERHDNVLDVIIIRKQRVIDHIFTGSVALLVSLLYINFGAAIDLTVLRNLVTRPVGPAIGFVTQFVLMPLLSYGLGYLIFPDSPEMQLGLFFTGVSPGGGASNIWSVLLGGNIHLSILMTTVSNFAAFGTMPFWLFTLGTTIFDRANMVVPYANIATFAVCLIVPLAIGMAIQKWSTRLTQLLVRLLKPISIFLILFIIIFATVTNIYLFKLFSWQIAVAGCALPWLGYSIAWIAARLLKQDKADALTIAIETGIQNTGISIFLLRFSLPQPQADLTTIIPVAVAIMTPFPLLGIYIYKKFTKPKENYSITEGFNKEEEDSHSK